MPEVKGYKAFHKFANSAGKSGGITMYVLNKWSPQSISDPNKVQDLLWLHLKGDNQEFAICTVYLKVVDGCRPIERLDNIEYNEETWTSLTGKVTELYRANVNVVISEDFNGHIGNEINPRGI